ncbi:hypothetical protein BKA70DRAFT_1563160 [Coprinopsis sp. MPI-PUGE-AT-0042]|nr:hypothetical protein BKA70DRAFT_1563160 [Coprinopsis sp. MPI-PUGE-AT-0042]
MPVLTFLCHLQLSHHLSPQLDRFCFPVPSSAPPAQLRLPHITGHPKPATAMEPPQAIEGMLAVVDLAILYTFQRRTLLLAESGCLLAYHAAKVIQTSAVCAQVNGQCEAVTTLVLPTLLHEIKTADESQFNTGVSLPSTSSPPGHSVIAEEFESPRLFGYVGAATLSCFDIAKPTTNFDLLVVDSAVELDRALQCTSSVSVFQPHTSHVARIPNRPEQTLASTMRKKKSSTPFAEECHSSPPRVTRHPLLSLKYLRLQPPTDLTVSANFYPHGAGYRKVDNVVNQPPPPASQWP